MNKIFLVFTLSIAFNLSFFKVSQAEENFEENFYKKLEYKLLIQKIDLKNFPDISVSVTPQDNNKRSILVPKEQVKNIFYIKENNKNISDFSVDLPKTNNTVLSICFVIDNSYLMENNIAKIKKVVKSLSKNLYPNDYVSIIEVNSLSKVFLEPKAYKNINLEKELDKITSKQKSDFKPLYESIADAVNVSSKLENLKKVVIVLSNGLNASASKSTKISDFTSIANSKNITIHTIYFDTPLSNNSVMTEISQKTLGFPTSITDKDPSSIGNYYYTQKIVTDLSLPYVFKFKSNFVFSNIEALNFIYLKLNKLFKMQPTERDLKFSSIIDGKNNVKENIKRFVIPQQFIDKDIPLWFKLLIIFVIMSFLLFSFFIILKLKNKKSYRVDNSNINPITVNNVLPITTSFENTEDLTQIDHSTYSKPTLDEDLTQIDHNNFNSDETHYDFPDESQENEDDEKTVLSKLKKDKAFLVYKTGKNQHFLSELNDIEIIGRKKDLKFYVPDSEASKEHCKVFFNPEDKAYFVEDLESLNGILVNNKETLKSVLNDGDEILIGSTILVFKIVKLNRV